MSRLIAVVAALGALAALDGAWASAASQCRVSQLSARAGPSQAGLGHVGFVLVLTNRSATSCATGGFVGLQRLGARHRPLITDTHRGSGYLYRSPPPRTILLAPGHSVSAGVEWLDGPVGSEPDSCSAAGHFLEVTPPDDTAHLVIRAATADCDHGYVSTTALVAGTHGPAA